MIIIEGSNKTGKTTLAKKLLSDLSYFRYHKFGDIPQTQKEFDNQLGISLELIGKCTIQDRCPMVSELIYTSKPFKNYELIQDRNPFILPNTSISLIKKYRPILVLCNAAPNETEQITIWNRYLDFFYGLGPSITYLIYDFRHDKYDYLLDSLKRIIAFRLR